MCVIIHKPKDIIIPDDDFTLAHENNPDGFGYMYIDENGKFIQEHLLDPSTAKILELMDELDEYEVLIHFRFTTVGDTCLEQCHPFQVLRKTTKRPAIWMMHNGTFSTVPCYEEENDTQGFIRQLLKPLLSVDHTLLNDAVWCKWIDHVAGWSKMAFMDGSGVITKTGDFSSREGIHSDLASDDQEKAEYFVSNTYSFRSGHRIPASTVPWTDPYYDETYGYGRVITPNAKYDPNTYTEEYASSILLSNVYDTLAALGVMSLTELTQWFKDEPNEAFEVMLEYIPDEMEEAATLCASEYGIPKDPFGWITNYPEDAALLLQEWNN